MKRLIILILFCASIVNADDRLILARSNPYVLGSVPVVAGDTYTDILFWWRCEGTTLGADDYYGTGDNTAANQNTAAINTDAVKIGTNGLDADAGWDGYAFTVSSSDLVDTSSGRVGLWLYVNTWVDNMPFWQTTGSGVEASLKLYDGDDLHFYWKDGTNDNGIYTVGLGLSTGTWYFLEIAWSATSNYKKIYKDGVELSVSTYNGTGVDAFTNTEMRVGICNAMAADLFMDNIMVSNDPTRDFNALKNETASPR